MSPEPHRIMGQVATYGFTLLHWKVLELSFDCTPLPDLIQEHHYGASTDRDETFIPETSVVETARALRALAEMGAVYLAEGEHTLTPPEVAAICSDTAPFDRVSGAFTVEVVNRPLAGDLLRQRPADQSPHRPNH
jgi:hypothetical protein